MVMNSSMSLIETIRNNSQGKPVIGCFPLYPPVELFESFGFLPVVLWNLKESLNTLEISDKHIQPYACSVARELAQFTMGETGTVLNAIFSYNACDTLRNLPEILRLSNTEAGRDIPMFRIHLPQVDRTQSNPINYLKNEINLLVQAIETKGNLTFSSSQFKEITEKYTKMRALSAKAEERVGEGTISFESFCRTILSGYLYPVDKQIERLEELIAGASATPAPAKSRVIVSGIMPPPLPVIRAMESAGLRVVANDIASMKRSYSCHSAPTENPADYYATLFTNRSACTTLLYTSDARLNELTNMVSWGKADGLIFCGEKFCEHEYFEYPFIKKRLSETGIQTLFLEFSADDKQNVGAHITRIEAFSEILESR